MEVAFPMSDWNGELAGGTGGALWKRRGWLRRAWK